MPNDNTQPATATVTRVDYAALDGVILLTARSGCGKTVHHGGGNDVDNIALGSRVAHCGCDDYELIDPDGVIAEAMPALQIAAETHRARTARRLARVNAGASS